MNIVMSAHIDLAYPVPFVRFDSSGLYGLVDNIAGLLCAYTASRKTNTPIYFTNFEEVDFGGAIEVAKILEGTDTLVIVVDTCTDAQNKGAYIGNSYNFSVERLRQKFDKKIFFMDELYEPDMDETCIYGGDYKLPTFFYGIPIQNDYHDVDNHVKTKVVDTATELLINVIQTIQTQYSN